MIKYTLKYEDTESDVHCPAREILHQILGEQTWEELLPFITEYLRGIGYHFNGTLAIVDENGEIQ